MLVILLIGFSLGGLSAAYLTERTYGLGAINVGPWSAWPFVGGVEIDPYTTARVRSDGVIPLGAAEGLSFEALNDSSGKVLRQECRYVLSGDTSIARLWTLSAYDKSGKLTLVTDNKKSAIFSGSLLRFPDGSFTINLSHSPQSGNWLPLNDNGEFRLVMRLYDTPITSNSGLIIPTMPSIDLVECQS